MGTVLYFTRFKRAKGQTTSPSSRLWVTKYVFLVIIVLVALLGFAGPIFDWMRNYPLITSVGIITLLAVSIGLNLKIDLFWCRYLCPLGAAAGLVSRIAPMRRLVHAHCNDCSICVDSCAMGVIDPRREFINDPRGPQTSLTIAFFNKSLFSQRKLQYLILQSVGIQRA